MNRQEPSYEDVCRLGDISELRGIIAIGSLLGILVLLITWIPSGFLITDYEGRTITPPEYFEAVELEKYATTWNITFDGSHSKEYWYFGIYHYYISFEIGGYDLRLLYARPNHTISGYDDGILVIWHMEKWWIFETGFHEMEFSNQGEDRGISLSRTELDDDYDRNDLSYTVECSHVQMDIFLAFNETAYNSPSEAFDDSNLKMMLGVEWDQVQTSMAAWKIIGMLLFFQLPNVHWMINAIIAIPIWLGIAYISYILILRAIGAVFGGGA